ncbi:MAG: hypothetical protein ABFS32_11155 [Bacteroidota bacterium]
MKKIYTILIALITISFTSCFQEVGPAGPPGPEGPTGPAGADGESAFVFEYSDVDFISPNYEVFLDYPDGFEGLDTDVSLVYLLWEVVQDDQANDLEIWRALPQTVFTENGFIYYNFDFSKIDAHLFMITDFDPTLLEAIDTDDWIVRIVVIPGDLYTGGRPSIDHSDYSAVKEAYSLPDLPVHKGYKRR